MPKEYYLYVNGQRVKVSEQIYKVYWREKEHEKYLEQVGKKNHLLFFFSSMVAKDDGNNCRLFLCKSQGERREEEWTLTISITGKQKALIF